MELQTLGRRGESDVAFCSAPCHRCPRPPLRGPPLAGRLSARSPSAVPRAPVPPPALGHGACPWGLAQCAAPCHMIAQNAAKFYTHTAHAHCAKPQEAGASRSAGCGSHCAPRQCAGRGLRQPALAPPRTGISRRPARDSTARRIIRNGGRAPARWGALQASLEQAPTRRSLLQRRVWATQHLSVSLSAPCLRGDGGCSSVTTAPDLQKAGVSCLESLLILSTIPPPRPATQP